MASAVSAAYPRRALSWTAVRICLTATALAVIVAGVFLPPLYVLGGVAGLGIFALTLRFPVFGFCALAFSVPWGSGFPVAVGSFPITSTDLVVAAITAALLCESVATRANPLPATPWSAAMLLFLAALALSALQALDVHASIREIVKWMECFAVYCAAARLIRTRTALVMVVAALIGAGVSQAILGYVQFGLHLGPQAFAHGQYLRAYGTFDQPNPYAGYLNMVLPLALAFFLMARGAHLRALYGCATMLIAGGLLASQSRGALLAGGLATAVVLAVVSRTFYRLTWIGVLGLVTGGLFASYNLVPLGPFQKLLDAVGLGGVSFGHVTDANFSAVERAAHWLAGVRMFAQHPLLGVGIGNYAVAYPSVHPRGWYDPLAHAHNYYINIAAESGVIGLAAYLLMVGLALWYSYAAIRRVHDRYYFAAVLGVIGALVATNFHNLFDVLYVHGMTALLGLLMAFVTISFRDGLGRSAESSAQAMPGQI